MESESDDDLIRMSARSVKLEKAFTSRVKRHFYPVDTPKHGLSPGTLATMLHGRHRSAILASASECYNLKRKYTPNTGTASAPLGVLSISNPERPHFKLSLGKKLSRLRQDSSAEQDFEEVIAGGMEEHKVDIEMEDTEMEGREE